MLPLPRSLSAPSATDKHKPTSAQPIASQRQFEGKCLTGQRDKQEEGRNKKQPGTCEVMWSEREGKVNENLIWRCKCHVAILVACRPGCFFYLHCSVLSSDNGLSLQSYSPGETLDKLAATRRLSVGKRVMRELGSHPQARLCLLMCKYSSFGERGAQEQPRTGTDTPRRQILTQTQKHCTPTHAVFLLDA